jgi:cytochrome oxidase Cu insertion factor (SCO1/SenC/PrrC family)
MKMIILTTLAAICCHTPSFGQPGRGGNDRLQRAGLAVGQSIPTTDLYSSDGREFSLSELRGSYTVLIFGCLT